MAKHRKNARKIRKKNNRFLTRLFIFFIPHHIRSIKGWLWFSVSRLGLSVATFYISLTLIFSVIPVPFSAYMVQKKVEYLLQGENYPIQYQWVSLERIAWQMQVATIAGEDQKFSSHLGLDISAIELAFKRNSKHQHKKAIGASTISQQTVKNLYLWHGSSWLRKGIEVPLTLLVESMWDKPRILEIYLNIAEFGEGIFGVEQASRHYFNKSAKNLTLAEASLLVASLPNPHLYQVDKPSQTMKKRQQWIMQQVHNLGGRGYLEKL